MKGAKLGSGVFRFYEVILTNLAQVVSNGRFRNCYTVHTWDFFKGPSCTLQMKSVVVYICVIQNDDLLL